MNKQVINVPPSTRVKVTQGRSLLGHLWYKLLKRWSKYFTTSKVKGSDV